MASNTEPFNPFDKSRLLYYEKAPYEENTTRQVSDIEDISIGLAEDLAFLISGGDCGGGNRGTQDVRIVDRKDGEM